jgi:hypothetical protein
MSRKNPTKLGKKHVGAFQGYEVYTVNPFGVRDLTESDEEFTNFALHSQFPKLIPQGEIWIGENLLNDEGLFFIANAVTTLVEQERGASEDTASTSGTNVERFLRGRLLDVKFRAGRPHRRVPRRIYVHPYLTLPDEKFPVTVWIVDGCLARAFYKTDYTEGGHGYVYPWVPKDEIWIEKAIDRSEVPFIVSHEYIELRLMRDEGLEYDPAHDICSQFEYCLREDRSVRTLLTPRGRKLVKRDLPKLTEPEIFAHVVKTYVKR